MVRGLREGFLLSIIRSLRKSWKLRKLSKRLGTWASRDQTTENFVKGEIQKFKSGEEPKGARLVLEQLLDLCEADPNVRLVMNHYGGDREKLREIYWTLCACGAGCWARGHWVPASSLVFAPTLSFLLHQEAVEKFRDRYQRTNVARRLVKYFEQGEVGHVREE